MCDTGFQPMRTNRVQLHSAHPASGFGQANTAARHGTSSRQVVDKMTTPRTESSIARSVPPDTILCKYMHGPCVGFFDRGASGFSTETIGRRGPVALRGIIHYARKSRVPISGA